MRQSRATVARSVLVLNAGSSTLKFELLDVDRWASLGSGLIDRVSDPAEGFARFYEESSRLLQDPSGLAVIGHRVVHGGERFVEPTRIDADTLGALRELVDLAPLHNPPALIGIDLAQKRFPGTPNVAVFDTAFHRSLPPRAYRYALPRETYLHDRIRRYGFHGTSHSFVAKQAAGLLGRPLDQIDLITLHLGNGASACAIQRGQSVDTSMGFTPLEGLVMGTRSGDLDPAISIYLATKLGKSPREVEQLLEHDSGLVGLCGSSDVRDVLRRAEAQDPDAELAIAVYCYRVKKYVGAYLAALGRADAIVFTAGVGENAAPIRRACLEGLADLGIEVDPAKNSARSTGPREIQSAASRIKVLVIPTNETLEIAQQALAVVDDRGAPR
jgi:acetate kinase